MRDQESFGDRNRLAAEMQAIVKRAAEPVQAGESIKAQMVRAWGALGRPPFWRVRAAWWGDAGVWVGSAVEDFRARGNALNEKRRRSQDARTQSLHAETAVAHARLRRLREALTATDPNFYRDQIDALDWALRTRNSTDPAE